MLRLGANFFAQQGPGVKAARTRRQTRKEPWLDTGCARIQSLLGAAGAIPILYARGATISAPPYIQSLEYKNSQFFMPLESYQLMD
jgi:hypothetical protein